MGHFQRLLGRGNPTYGWTENPRVILQFDLDNHRLCDVGLGSPLNRCSFLGRGRANQGDVCYDDKGLVLCVEDGRLAGFVLYFGHAEEPRRGRYAGEFLVHGNLVQLSADTSDEDFRRQFGQPYWHDSDDDETLLFYEHGKTEWQVEFGRDRRLKAIIVTDDPMMADPDQRASYGVTEPWPPGTAPDTAGRGSDLASSHARTNIANIQRTPSLARIIGVFRRREFKWVMVALVPPAASATALAIRLHDAGAFSMFVVGGGFGAVLCLSLCFGRVVGRTRTISRSANPIEYWLDVLINAAAYVGCCVLGFVG